MPFPLCVLLLSVLRSVTSNRIKIYIDEFALEADNSTRVQHPKSRTRSTKGKPCSIGSPKKAGILDKIVDESSGLVCSQTLKGVCYTHNDKGAARIFAVNTSGHLLSVIYLKGANNRDWEDIGVAGNKIYIGDIGDNSAKKLSKTIYRIDETRDVLTQPELRVVAEKFKFSMPKEHGGQNAESMLVDPTGKTIYVLTKEADNPSKHPHARGKMILKVTWGDPSSAMYVGTIWSGMRGKLTGADISSDGSAIAARTYSTLYLWRLSRDSRSELPEQVMQTRPCAQLRHKEKQSETIAFSGDGSKLLTTSEGAKLPIWEFQLPFMNKIDNSPGVDGKPRHSQEYEGLRMCQGDCDKDSDCVGDLVCFQRDRNTPVPGCEGEGVKNFDYCTFA